MVSLTRDPDQLGMGNTRMAPVRSFTPLGTGASASSCERASRTRPRRRALICAGAAAVGAMTVTFGCGTADDAEAPGIADPVLASGGLAYVEQRFGLRTDGSGRGMIYNKATGRDVNLWGVNYYPTSSLTRWAMNKAGLTTATQAKDEIRRDLDDLAFLHVNHIRIHIFDREITGPCGQLVDNEHLDLLEYLLDQAGQRGLAVQLTPIAWWWSPYAQPVPGPLANWWHKKAFIVGGMFNPNAKGVSKPGDCGDGSSLWTRQSRYLGQLLNKLNRYNGITIGRQPAVSMIEIMNEPEFWNYQEVKRAADHNWATPYLPTDVQSNMWNLNDLKLVWADYLDIRAYNGWGDSSWAWGEMVYWRTYDYANAMIAAVRAASHADALVGFSLFGKNYWGAFQTGEGAIRNRHLDAIAASSADFVTEGFYPAFGAACLPYPNDWQCNSDGFNLLSGAVDHQINTWKNGLKYTHNAAMKAKGRTVYEWGTAGGTTKAYAMVAMAREMRQAGVQAAAFFQYDTRTSAKLNGTYSDYASPNYPEAYNIHFLNLYHSPTQAVDFFAARKTFWNVPLWGSYAAPSDNQWAWATYSSYSGNFSAASDPWSYTQSRSTTASNPVEWYDLTQVGDIVTCVGDCRYWNYAGTGVVRFQVSAARMATLTVCPDVIRLRTNLYAPSTDPALPISQLSSGTQRSLTFTRGLANNQSVTFVVPAACTVVKIVTW